MNLNVNKLQAGRMGDAVALLCRAFRDDPVFSHYFPDASSRSRVFRLVFADLIAANRRFGSVYGAEEGPQLLGAAIWRAPQATSSFWDRVRGAYVQFRLRRLSRPAADGLGEGFGVLEHLHPSEPHWYLAFVGVAPTRQAEGIGAKLLTPVVAIADAANQPCYLETPFPQTHAFYRGFGFEILEKCSPFPGTPPVWRMLRRPGPR